MAATGLVVKDARIVVLDDNPTNVLLLEAMLEEDGFTNVTGYTNPVTALEAMLEAPPDLVLLDIRMPVLDGHQVLARLMSGVDDYLPVIVLTAQTDSETRMRALAGGARDFLSKPFDQAEVLHRIRNTLETKLLFNDRREQAAQLEKVVIERTRELAFMATHDLLTGLPNRAALRERMVEMAAAGEGCVLLVSVERLEGVVDALGTVLGEAALRQCAETLKDLLPEDARIGCWGGTEFMIVIPHGVADQWARRIMDFFRVPMRCNAVELILDARIGTCQYPQDGSDADRLVQRAGLAMITARRGGNDFAAYTTALEETANRKHVLERELRKAIERNQLQVVYQPKLRLADRSVVGMEALLRWTHPELGFVSPVQFIPVAEETGAIVPIGEWVLRQSCADCLEWRKLGYDLTVAVNVSGRQFDEPNLPGTVAHVLGQTGLPSRALEVEITETALLRDLGRAKQVLTAIRELGVAIAIDDFGTGYSSLSYLRQLPLNTLKVDQSFVRHLDTNPDDRALTRTIVAMAQTLGLEAVAEGIESDTHAAFLLEQDCALGQGYLFAKPMSAPDFTRWLEAHAVRMEGVL